MPSELLLVSERSAALARHLLPLPPHNLALPPTLPDPFALPPHPLAQLAAIAAQRRIGESPAGHCLQHHQGGMVGVLVVQQADGSSAWLCAATLPLVTPMPSPMPSPMAWMLPDLALANDFPTPDDAFPDVTRELALLESNWPGDVALQEASEVAAQALLEWQLISLGTPGAAGREASRLQKAHVRETKSRWRSATRRHNELRQQSAQLRQLRQAAQRQHSHHKATRCCICNAMGEVHRVADYFPASEIPPGAGACVAPRLFDFAFRHGLRPLAFAQFWWGPPPRAEVRRHGRFYAPCRGRCGVLLPALLPALLRGMTLASRSVNEHFNEPRVVHETRHWLLLEKAAGVLSVPGKGAASSVQDWLQLYCGDAAAPMLVHRLDQATSGLLLAAKNAETHRQLQAQFIARTVRKRYEALLQGGLAATQGEISLPLRPDLHDRPRQRVCREHGRAALTYWRALERQDGVSRVELAPHTGRTHQLRLHAAHHEGLNAPIIGDALYGEAASRLMLHARELVFQDPDSGAEKIFSSEVPF